MPVAKAKPSTMAISNAGRSRSTTEDGEATVSGAVQLSSLKQQMMRDAEVLLMEKIPDRIAHLNALLTSPDFNLEPGACHAEINIPRPSPTMVAAAAAAALGSSATEKAQSAQSTTATTRTVEGNSVSTSNSQSDGADNNHSSSKRKRLMSSNDDSGDKLSTAYPSEISTVATAVPSGGVVGLEGTKVLLLPCGSVDVNRTIAGLFDVVKPLILQQVNDCNLLKMWIELLIPKVEDGNNFGVDIQEECLKEVATIESESAVYLDHASRYFVARGKLIAKVAKYPHVEDFRRTVDELDEKQYLNLRLIVLEMRNNYASIHDLITKNLEKIKRPRSNSAADSLY